MNDKKMQTILVVDDSPENVTDLSELLQPEYRVRVATTGARALQVAASRPHPDLILLDAMMPEMDGYDVFENLRATPETSKIPVIFVTATDSVESELRGLDAGAVDYITKPILPQIAMARVRNQLELKQTRDWLSDQNAYLEAEVARRMQENELIQKISVRALAHLAEIRDLETGNHILRIRAYVQHLAESLQKLPRFAGVLSDHYVELLTRSAPLHDIGRVGIPDAILRKPGPLTVEEWRIMKTHAKLGRDAIEMAERDATRNVEFLALAKEIAHWHHEQWDGNGYPDGLTGEAIPVSARIMAVATCSIR
ncbi:response regulator [Methylomonas koyamae]|uniref:response regulator n=1 Tax=Methylomonas koyamae TaxID=702114 RepID=UPI000B2ADAAB|nr:response regulator [Methylomonas koyamae]